MKMKLFILMSSLGLLAGCGTLDYTSADYAAAASCSSCFNPCPAGSSYSADSSCSSCSSCRFSQRSSSMQTGISEDAVTPSCEPHYESTIFRERYHWDHGTQMPVSANATSCSSAPSFFKSESCFKGECVRRPLINNI
jgi:hypothetical protein